MTLSITKRGDQVVAGVPAQLTAGNRLELKQRLLDELERGERKFLIDFSETAYIDSTGLGVLVSLRKKVREQGGEFRLANPSDDLRRFFELTRLDTLFGIENGDEGGGGAARPESAGLSQRAGVERVAT